MFKRQFAFAPSKVNLLDKELYDEVIHEGDKAYLTLKKTVKIGYADSFSDAMYSIGDILSYFIEDSVEEITVTNGFSTLKGIGSTTGETVMDLTCDFFNYCLPDMQRVTIEAKGTLNPARYIEGNFLGCFEADVRTEGLLTVRNGYASVNGSPLPVMKQNGKSVSCGNMVTALTITHGSELFRAELQYITVDAETGSLVKNSIYSFSNEEQLLDHLKKEGKYQGFIEETLYVLQ